MNYKDYQKARDAAWRILIDGKINRLPVDLNAIRETLGIHVYTYQKAKEWIRDNDLERITKESDGLTTYWNGEPIILYDGTVTPPRARFTVAHEIGHLVLGHVKHGEATERNRDPRPGDAPIETAANQFAARLLAPACVLWGIGIHTPEEIVQLCNISKAAAEFRAGRMEELYRRNKFLTSPLEREVYTMFLPFIKEESRRRKGD